MELQQCVDLVKDAPLGQVIGLGAFAIVTVVFSLIKKDLPSFVKDVAKGAIGIFKKK